MAITRREFLKQTAGGITLATASLSFPSVFARTAAAATRTDPNGRILVMLQLSGGNDGLNTVIPYRDDRYYQLRPTLGVKRGEVITLDGELGLHPQLRGLKELFDDGWLSVVQGVGYPNPNRSHFQSMDIWHTGDPSLLNLQTGWLGRTLGHGRELHALHIDHEPLPLALRAEREDVPSVQSIESFRLQGGADAPASRVIEAILAGTGSASEPIARDPVGLAPGLDDLQFVRRTAVSACANARRLAALPPDSAASYPNFGLARRLHDIARLITADFGPRIFYTSLGGFDTHARQNTTHPNLMNELSSSVRAFFADLKQQGVADRVLLVTFSEFGRRAAENASLGTDHGAAAPLFVAGPAVRGGILGQRPDFSQLVDGDIPHGLDFRGVYATVLEDWLSIPATPILGGTFDKCRFV